MAQPKAPAVNGTVNGHPLRLSNAPTIHCGPSGLVTRQSRLWFGLEHHPCFPILCLTIWICIGCEALSSSFGCGAPYGLISRSAGKVFSLKCFLLIDVHDDPKPEFSKMGGAATSWAPREHPKAECLKWRCGPSQVTVQSKSAKITEVGWHLIMNHVLLHHPL